MLDRDGIGDPGHKIIQPIGELNYERTDPIPAPASAPDPVVEHTKTSEEWDSYKTTNGAYEVATQYIDGKFACLYVKNRPKGRGLPDTLRFTDQADIQELLTALHAAVAGIHKRKDQSDVSNAR